MGNLIWYQIRYPWDLNLNFSLFFQVKKNTTGLYYLMTFFFTLHFWGQTFPLLSLRVWEESPLHQFLICEPLILHLLLEIFAASAKISLSVSRQISPISTGYVGSQQSTKQGFRSTFPIKSSTHRSFRPSNFCSHGVSLDSQNDCVLPPPPIAPSPRRFCSGSSLSLSLFACVYVYMILILVICWVIRSLGLKLRGETPGDPKIWAVGARFDNHPLFLILHLFGCWENWWETKT